MRILAGILAAVALCPAPAGAWQAAGAAAERPNFVVVLADDLGFGDLGCFGHPTIRTPRLDRMAAEGLRFTDLHAASAVCTPSRAALLTGRLPVRNGMCGHRRRDVLRQDDRGGLPLEEVTLAEALRDAGYATAAIGKWHLGHRPECLPPRHGFDVSLVAPWSNDMRPYYLVDGAARVPGEVDQTTLTRRLTDRALEFIRDQAERPFFLYLAHPFPHVPLHASPEFAGKSPRGPYGDVVEELDASTGRILDALEELGIAGRTLVFFTSDNGPWLTQGPAGGSAGLLRDGKGSTFEGGVRVPTIAWWPGRVAPGGVARGMASTMDLFATCVGLAGGALPDDRTLDSHDLSPVLFGRGPSTRAHLFHYRGAELFAVRSGRWKAHLHTQPAYGPGAREDHDPPLLFDVERDPSERFDRAAERPEAVGELRALVAAHRAGLVAPRSQLELDPRPVTVVPVASAEDRAAAAGWGSGTWTDQHEAICALARARPLDLVFLGDSITQSFGGAGRSVSSPGGEVWERHYGLRRAGNFGISGDRTQHVLWRLEHGAFGDARPKLVVLLIGTNSLPHDPPQDVAFGVEAVVARLGELLPETRVLLLGLLPRGEQPDDPLRAAVRAVNARLACLDDGRRVRFRDLAEVFLLPDGRGDPALLAGDFLHLRPAGYAAWAAAIEPEVARALGE